MNSENKLNTKGKNLSLDVIRIIATLMIFLFHINIHFGFITHIAIADKVINVGAVFMVLFIMLSGTVLHLSYHNVNFFTDECSLTAFYKKRIKRIYPSYLIFLLIMLVFRQSFAKTPLQTINILIIDLFGLQAWFPKTFSILGNGGTWFISTILFLYIMYPLINKIVSCVNKKIIFIFCLFGGVLVGFSRVILGGDFQSYYALPIFRIFEFTIGVVIAEKIISYKDKEPIKSKACLFHFVILFLLYFGVVYSLYNVKLFDLDFFKTNYLSYNIVAIPIFALLIFFAYFVDLSHLPKAVKKAISFLSSLSFPFYIVQTLANRLLGVWKNDSLFGWEISHNWQILLIALSLNFVFAIMLFYLEKIVVKTTGNLIVKIRLKMGKTK